MNNTASLPEVRGRYRFNADLDKMCWFGVGGRAFVVFFPADIDDLVCFLRRKDPALYVYVMGVGSNLLIPDDGFQGVVIRLGRGFNYIHHSDLFVTAGAAAMDLNVALYAAQHAISGLEFLSGIPGTIGGALAMNAGAYGHDIKSILLEATAVDLHGNIKVFSVDEIGYSYRSKTLNDNWIFTEAKFLGKPGCEEEIFINIKRIQEERLKTQPIKSKTCGSTFKNPQGFKAWELIKNSGLSGASVGGASISTMHCNFIINTGCATASDIENLIKYVKKTVYENTGIMLEEEVKRMKI